MLRSNSSIPSARLSESPSTGAEPVSRNSVPLPRNILREEAVSILRLLRKHWLPTVGTDGKAIPGFVSLGEQRLPLVTASRIEDLVARLDEEDRVHAAHGRGKVRERVEEGRELHASLSSLAKAAFFRGTHPAQHREARALEERHVGASSAGEVAAALDDYAALIERHVAVVDGLGGFSRDDLAGARVLATELRVYACPLLVAKAKEVSASRPVTARELHLVCQRVRHYAKFLFRQKIEVYRQFTSVYLRVQRARLRRNDRIRKARESRG